MEKEWDEAVENEEKFYFGERVITPTGDEGTIVELDGDEYCVTGQVPMGWFKAEELTKIK